MGIFNRFKTKSVDAGKKTEKALVSKLAEEKKQPVAVSKEKIAVKKSDQVIKGLTKQAYRVLVKPLVTEKASSLSAAGKYLFVVNPKMNKVEIKKAVRAIYKVEPIKINIANFSGKSVRYGRTAGKTKDWKKAVVTLKPGDKIEIYEGV